jgi:hypothetical protein
MNQDTNSNTANSSYNFVFDSYEVLHDTQLELHYHYKDAHGTIIGTFVERYVLPTKINLDDHITRYILQHLHIIVGISYYKSLLGQVGVPYDLSNHEADYYNAIYHNGLGEYSYINKITGYIKPFKATAPTEHAAVPLETIGALLGIGGGKDSIVSAEIAKAIGLRTSVMHVATRDHDGQAGAVMKQANLDQLHVERYLDISIVEFTAKYNGMSGHIPLSAILAWIGLLVAYAKKLEYVMMANESAASSGNVDWNGMTINHQWSKSYQFETLTQDFVHKHISPNLWYFSPIRPYGSLAVVALFAKLGKNYYSSFTSCNLVLRIDPSERPNGRWCTRCAKCLSSWLLLSASLGDDQLLQIFGRNLFDDVSLRPTFKALVGLEDHKPLDCVGTTEELRAVTRQAMDRNQDIPLLESVQADDIPGPTILQLLKSRGHNNMPSELAGQIETFVTKNL